METIHPSIECILADMENLAADSPEPSSAHIILGEENIPLQEIIEQVRAQTERGMKLAKAWSDMMRAS